MMGVNIDGKELARPVLLVVVITLVKRKFLVLRNMPLSKECQIVPQDIILVV
jgi:hypothetical protein